MRRLARPLLYGGVLVVVFGLAQMHARFIGHYSFTGTGRFRWTVLYAGLLSVIAYAFGLPDAQRSRRAALGPAVGAAFLGAVAISVVQVFVGDALLPRFVVFGSALLLPDWYRLWVSIAVDGRSRARARGRLAELESADEAGTLATVVNGRAVVGCEPPRAHWDCSIAYALGLSEVRGCTTVGPDRSVNRQ